MTDTSQTENSLFAWSQSLAAAVERASQSIVAVDARPRVPTSGVVWRPGVIVSTNHTIRRNEEITVMLPAGNQSVPATLVGRDASTDLAVLRVADAGITTAAEIGDSAELKTGSIALAVGRVGESGVSASFGIVSQTGDRWRTWRGGEIDRLLRLDLAIYLGFSGGALVDAHGRIHGINTSGLSRGSALSIPASTINRVVDTLLEKGHVARPYVGIGMHPVRVPEKLQTTLQLPTDTGLVVLSVDPEGPADKAGVLVGDIVVAVNDRPISDTDDVQAALGRERVGNSLKASLIRGGELKEAVITIGERPPQQQRGRR